MEFKLWLEAAEEWKLAIFSGIQKAAKYLKFTAGGLGLVTGAAIAFHVPHLQGTIGRMLMYGVGGMFLASLPFRKLEDFAYNVILKINDKLANREHPDLPTIEKVAQEIVTQNLTQLKHYKK